MTGPFEPLGDVPQWRKLYDLVMENISNGNMDIMYQQAEQILERDRTTVQGVMQKAVRHLEKTTDWTLTTRANFGWVVEPHQSRIGHATDQLKKSGRAARRAARKVDFTADQRGKLTQFQREEADRAAQRALNIRRLQRPSWTAEELRTKQLPGN